MKNIFLIIFIILSSCGYPDIDTIPNFEDLVLTEEESIDLCKLTNTDNNELMKCLVSFYESQDKK